MAKADDLKRIAEIEMRSHMEFPPAIRGKCQADLDSRYRWWSDYFSPANSSDKISVHRVIYVAMIKLNIVGYIAGHLTSQRDTQGEIQSMNILKPQWGKGADVNLLRKLAKWFKFRGAASVCVRLAEDSPYRQFYAQHGATVVSDSLYRWDDIGKLTEES